MSVPLLGEQLKNLSDWLFSTRGMRILVLFQFGLLMYIAFRTNAAVDAAEYAVSAAESNRGGEVDLTQLEEEMTSLKRSVDNLDFELSRVRSEVQAVRTQLIFRP